MKRVLLVLLCALALCVSVSAHSGRTDANGGHTDSSTGEYHYHHGYPAHQHTDIDGDGKKDCPYDFDDKTGWNSGTTTSGKGGSSTTQKEVEIVEVEVIKEVPIEKPTDRVFESILLMVAVLSIGASIGFAIEKNEAIKQAEKYKRLLLDKITGKGEEDSRPEEAQTKLEETQEELRQAKFTILCKQRTIDQLNHQLAAERIAAEKKLAGYKELLLKRKSES